MAQARTVLKRVADGIGGGTKHARTVTHDLKRAQSAPARGRTMAAAKPNRVVGKDFESAVVRDAPLLQHPDGTQAVQLEKECELSEVPGYLLTSINKGKAILRGSLTDFEECASSAIIMAMDLETFQLWDETGTSEARHKVREAKISMSRTQKDPPQLVTCIICTISGFW